jgi:predicted transcriptional regulator
MTKGSSSRIRLEGISLFNIKLDGEMRRGLDELAERLRMPRSALVRMAVRNLLDNPQSVMASALERT